MNPQEEQNNSVMPTESVQPGTPQPTSVQPPQTAPNNKKSPLVIVIILLVLLLAVVGAFFFMSRDGDSNDAINSTSQQNDGSTNSANSQEESTQAETTSVVIPSLGLVVDDPEARGLEYSQETLEGPVGTETIHLLRDSKYNSFGECDGYTVNISTITEEQALENRDESNKGNYSYDRTVDVDGMWYSVGPGQYFQAGCAPDGVESVEHDTYAKELQLYVAKNIRKS